MSFSWIGLMLFAAILLPNLLFIAYPPQSSPENRPSSPKAPSLLENISRAALFTVLILFSGSSFAQAAADIWFILMCLCVGVYYVLWLRYLFGGREFRLLFCPLWVIPVPMAVFPALAFLFAGVWARFIPLILCAALFGVFHLWVSYNTYRQSR